jgi:membrane-bound metal-dependent hydrolase YbcI (DUF457 family)
MYGILDPALAGSFLKGELRTFGYRGHLLFGVIIAAALVGFHVAVGALEFALILFGSLLPDIDHRHAKLGRYNPFAHLRMAKHRGRCHTLIGVLLLSAPFYLLGGLTGLLFVFGGAVGHLCADKIYSFGKHKEPFAIRIW